MTTIPWIAWVLIALVLGAIFFAFIYTFWKTK